MIMTDIFTDTDYRRFDSTSSFSSRELVFNNLQFLDLTIYIITLGSNFRTNNLIPFFCLGSLIVCSRGLSQEFIATHRVCPDISGQMNWFCLWLQFKTRKSQLCMLFTVVSFIFFLTPILLRICFSIRSGLLMW